MDGPEENQRLAGVLFLDCGDEIEQALFNQIRCGIGEGVKDIGVNIGIGKGFGKI